MSFQPDTDIFAIARSLRTWRRAGLCLENRADLPTEIAATLLEFVAEFLGVTKARVEILQGRTATGTGSAVIGGEQVTLRLPRKPKWPMPGEYSHYSGFPRYEIRDQREWLVIFLAHELRHVLGAKGNRAGEFQCELTAAATLTHYRSMRRELLRRERIFKTKIKELL